MSKKMIFLFIIMMVISGCEAKVKDDVKEDVNTIEVDQNKDYVDPYLDDNPIELGLYVNNNESRDLVTSYDVDFIQYTDIISLEVYYTRDEVLSGSQKNLWNTYFNKYSDIDKYKIGFNISFQVGEDIRSVQILKPSDVNSIFDYVQIYLYDDINQDGGFYSHITDSEFNDNSILSSVKLTASTKIDDITSDIKVKVFTYDEDDFDDNGIYKGSSYYEAIISRK